MVTDAEARARKIREGRELRPCYLLVGDEVFLRDQVIEALAGRCTPGRRADPNYQRYEGDLDEIEKAVNSSFLLPLGSGIRLVIAIYEGLLKPEMAKTGRERKILDSIEDRFCTPVEGCCLVLSVKGCDERLKLWKLASTAGAVIWCNRPRRSLMASWVQSRAAGLGVQISKEAAELLSVARDNDMYRLWNDLNVLAAYHGWNGMVEKRTLEEFGLLNPEERAFELIDAFGRREPYTAFSLLRPFLASREASSRLFYMLARQFRLMWRTKILLQMGCSSQAVQAKLNVHPFVARKLCESSSRFSDTELREAVFALYAADLAIKSGRVGVETALGNFAMSVCSPSNARSQP